MVFHQVGDPADHARWDGQGLGSWSAVELTVSARSRHSPVTACWVRKVSALQRYAFVSRYPTECTHAPRLGAS
jgi:hypothetical protein